MAQLETLGTGGYERVEKTPLCDEANALLVSELQRSLCRDSDEVDSDLRIEAEFTHRRDYQTNFGTWLFTIPSALSLTTLNLLGYPFAAQSIELRIRVE